MQRAFNQLFARHDPDYTPEQAQGEVRPEDAQGSEGSAPTPFSMDAWASEEHQSPTEPQAEFTPRSTPRLKRATLSLLRTTAANRRTGNP